MDEMTLEEETELVRTWLRENGPPAAIARGFDGVIVRMGVFFGRQNVKIRWEVIRAALKERYPNYKEE